MVLQPADPECKVRLGKLKKVNTISDFTFWLRFSLRLSPSLNFGLSTYLSQKVKWFRWAKTWRLTRIV